MRVYRDGDHVIAAEKAVSIRIPRADLSDSASKARDALQAMLSESSRPKPFYDPTMDRLIEPPLPLEPDTQLDDVAVYKSLLLKAGSINELIPVLAFILDELAAGY